MAVLGTMERLGAALLLLLLVGSCEGYIESARTEQLFNTPYRSEESRHFDVRPPPPPCLSHLPPARKSKARRAVQSSFPWPRAMSQCHIVQDF